MVKPTLRRDLLFVLLALVAVNVFALTAQVTYRAGFPLDDSWIHQTYARNVMLTGSWDYIPGTPSAGSTSPLYTVLLALGYGLRLPPLLWVNLLGALALGGAAILGARLAEWLFPQQRAVGWWTGLAMLAAWHLVWAAASGMETMLFGALCLAVIGLATREHQPTELAIQRFGRGVAFGMVSAALVATRPEGILLLGLIAVTMLIERPQPTWREWWLWVGGAALGSITAIMPYILLNVSLNGTILPTTFSAKQADNAPLLQLGFFTNLGKMLEPLMAGGQLFLIVGCIAAVWQWRRNRNSQLLWRLLPLAWTVALIVLYTVRLPAWYQHGRYLMPAIPTFLVVGVGGVLLLVRGRQRHLIARVVSRSLAIATVLAFAIFFVLGAQAFAKDVQFIESDQVTAARWIKANVPTDQLLAARDIGAIGYFAPRPMLDIAGLISPEVIPIIRDSKALFDLILARQVRFIVLLPAQYDDLVIPSGQRAYWSQRLCPRFNAGGGMGGMTVYELVLDGTCNGLLPPLAAK